MAMEKIELKMTSIQNERMDSSFKQDTINLLKINKS